MAARISERSIITPLLMAVVAGAIGLRLMPEPQRLWGRDRDRESRLAMPGSGC